MPLFEVGQDTLNLLTYSLALYRFKGYVGGFEDLAKYLATLALEKMIVQTGRKFPEFKNLNPAWTDVRAIVRFLEKNKQIDHAEASKLHQYMDFRNSIMHAGNQMTADQIDRGTRELLRFLCNKVGKDYDEELEKRTLEDISTFGKEGPPEIAGFKRIVESDFDNLGNLYKKCSGLQQEIGKNLLRVGLYPVQKSGFTLDTGSIWLPWVMCNQKDRRAHISRASLSVIFTPTNVRIGLDFGSGAHEHRAKYFDMLLKKEIEAELRQLQSSGTEYSFCDTFWFYYIRNVRPIKWYFDFDQEKEKEIREALSETWRRKGEFLTGNKFLLGRVVDRDSKEFPNILENIVEESAKTLGELLPILAKIEGP